MKKIYFIIIALFSVGYIFSEVRKKKFSIKESFWWTLASLIMLFLAIFPYSINHIAKLFGVDYPPSLLFVFCTIFLIFMNFRNSKRISEHQEKITELAQRIALLEAKQHEKEK